ncbi:hypothetical protein [Komagataeibacter xylinus]|uniref:hypothetical protein n=1 Tax=Komagataeibacter xylinus TaxID=28448 RepID=UPI0011B5D49B|nr:hypothetical protein [Komagataeibacter xylinus]GBQ70634.1 hypothetical protein AA15237_0912 [Komagataeibacter xylinus NBRC 15237]
MNFSELENILATSSQDDWVVNDEHGVFSYKKDLNLYIKRAEFESLRAFNEGWATSHPDRNAFSEEYTVYYGPAVIKSITLVSVDGHRATLPMPKSANDLRVNIADVNFAKIVDVGNRVDEYLMRSGINIVY